MTEPNSNGQRAIDAILGQLKPRMASARVLLDQSLVAQHRQLEAELAAAAERDAHAPGLVLSSAKVAEQVRALEATLDAAKVEFQFQSIGSTAWVALLAKHPPTADQRKNRLSYNPLTFNAAAVAASCVDPAMGEDDAKALEARMDSGQWKLLIAACLDANEGGGDTPKSRIATEILSLSATFSTTAPAEESPDLGSLAGG